MTADSRVVPQQVPHLYILPSVYLAYQPCWHWVERHREARTLVGHGTIWSVVVASPGLPDTDGPNEMRPAWDSKDGGERDPSCRSVREGNTIEVSHRVSASWGRGAKPNR